MDKKWKLMMGVLMLSSIIFLGSCEEEGIVKIQKSSKGSNEGSSTDSNKISSKDSNKGPVKISKLVDNLVDNLEVSEKSESEEPKLPEGGEYEVVGGGYAVAIGEVDGSKKMWLSEEVNPRVWTEIESVKIKNAHSRNLPVSLRKSFPSRLTKISADGEALKVTDEDGDIWTSSDNGVNWGMEEFAGGDGTSGDPYQIASAAQLWLVRNHLAHHFQLIEDLNLSGVTESTGFEPIGHRRPFTGTFDGNGKKIQNLKINRPRQPNIGLFGAIVSMRGSTPALVKNMKLENVDVKGAGNVGGLVGRLRQAKIQSSEVTGKVVGTGLGRNIGGLVGMNEGTIETSHSTAQVEGITIVGGLVGSNRAKIKNSYATGQVNGRSRIGGLVGMHFGTKYVESQGKIENSYATGEVEGRGEEVGGLVGWNNGGKIVNSYATGLVKGHQGFVGGLVGKNEGAIEKSYAAGDVEGQGGTFPKIYGGLVGGNQKEGTVKNSYAMGDVDANARIGGLVGQNLGLIENGYAIGELVSHGGGSRVGGLVGFNNEPGIDDLGPSDPDDHGRINGKNYWKTNNEESSAERGVGKPGNKDKEYNVEEKSHKQLRALDAATTGWDATIWNFEAGKYPKLEWQD